MATQREVQAQKTRQKIIDCVYELLSTTDYNKIRIYDIAKNAGVSVGTVYLYFHSKADIATTLVRERNVILTKDHILRTDLSVVAQYQQYVDFYLNLIQSDGFEFSRGIMLALLEEYNGHQATEINLQEQYIESLIEYGIQSGELNPRAVTPQQFFDLFINCVNGALICWFYTKDEIDLIKGMNNVKQLIFLLL